MKKILQAFAITAISFASIASAATIEDLMVAVKRDSDIRAREVLQETQEIEKKLGRTNKSHDKLYADRLIDIDILLFDNLIIEEAGLIVPHPRFHLRDFVLTPFAEISPNTIHPVFDKSILQLKNELEQSM